MVICLIFFLIKSSQGVKKGAASKDSEIGDLRKEIEDYRSIVLKNAK